MDTTRPTLLRRVLDSNDASAWREFETLYGELILRQCGRMGLQLSDAEDVRQSVLVTLGEVLPNFEYQSSLGRFRGYLGRMVRNAVLSHRKKVARRREQELPDEKETLASTSLFDEIWEREWAQHHVRLAMRRLQVTFDPNRLAIFEQIVRGVSLTELSKEHGLSVDALHKLKQRVKARLQVELEAQLREAEFPQVQDDEA